MLISSHQLGELEALCSRYVYIEDGKLAEAFDGKEHPSILVNLELECDYSLLENHLSEFVVLEGRTLDISTSTDKETLNTIFELLSSYQMISSIDIKENHLKEIFMKG